MTKETYQPRGSTALLDAIGRCIKECTVNNPTVIILTDGLENTSHTYTNAHVKDLIEQKTTDGWTFVYLGANQDAFAEAGGLGIVGEGLLCLLWGRLLLLVPCLALLPRAGRRIGQSSRFPSCLDRSRVLSGLAHRSLLVPR